MCNRFPGAAFEAQKIAEVARQADIVGRDFAHFLEILQRLVDFARCRKHGAEKEAQIGASRRCVERAAQSFFGLGKAILPHCLETHSLRLAIVIMLCSPSIVLPPNTRGPAACFSASLPSFLMKNGE
jgi:hypothetical protein